MTATEQQKMLPEFCHSHPVYIHVCCPDLVGLKWKRKQPSLESNLRSTNLAGSSNHCTRQKAQIFSVLRQIGKEICKLASKYATYVPITWLF